MRVRSLSFALLAFWMCGSGGPPAHAADIDAQRDLVNGGVVGLVSGGVTGTYVRIAADLADALDDGYQMRVLPIIGKGSVRNIEDPRERIEKLLSFDDAAARFAWTLTAKTLAYSAALVGEIADDIISIDRAMRWGFNWELGPFETWDAIGVAASVERMKKDGIAVPDWVSRANGLAGMLAFSLFANRIRLDKLSEDAHTLS